MPQNISNAARGCAPQQDIPQREEHRKIEDRGEPAIDAVVAPHSSGEKRSHTRIGMKHFADRS